MLSNVPSDRPPSKTLGFSLVEIVVVVTLVSMGTAFAVPRFTSLANRARASEVLALSAGLRDATQVAHNQFVASGSNLLAAKLKGKAVVLKNGYPDATSSGIGNAVVDSGGFITKSNPSSVTFFKTGAPLDTQCSVTYRAASHPSIAATITDINLSGC
jgi:type II secretory pathway pseudopilin PulG